ncbi:hypothetical protein AR679_gp094 [Yellowstone lake phycodnavirus 1]|uniref:hypothetical protein n=1 Tax=Yellowstone lake phycodnavirus 1 TaxID=1586713 RepID=UPI0006EBB3D3|nr:hypothetical protein AR679_gp094 [Yellowstone lake phycodnavirus 1]BAT22120.1 hypothetical protein [Yellowstone lake phycodnavirus 1]
MAGKDNKVMIGVIILGAFATILVIVLGVYFSQFTCPGFGYNCPASPVPSPVTTPTVTTPTVTTPTVTTPTVTTPTVTTPTVTTPTVTTPTGGSPSSTPGAPLVPVVVNPPTPATQPPPPAVPTPNPYVSTPAPPPPATGVHGFVSLQTVNRTVNITPNSPTAVTAGDAGVADGTPINTWNVPNLNTAAYIRFSDGNVMKVRNIAYYNFYGYFIDSTGASRATPYSTRTTFSSFELGNFYP